MKKIEKIKKITIKDDFRAFVNSLNLSRDDYKTMMEYIDELPAVQPEIIRCKDCKHWRDDHTCHEHSLVSPMCANEYCSRAERRSE